MNGPIASARDISPTPTDDQLVAIVAAMEWAWPKPVLLVDAAAESSTTTDWRFSGRWWNNHPLTRRPRP